MASLSFFDRMADFVLKWREAVFWVMISLLASQAAIHIENAKLYTWGDENH